MTESDPLPTLYSVPYGFGGDPYAPGAYCPSFQGQPAPDVFGPGGFTGQDAFYPDAGAEMRGMPFQNYEPNGGFGGGGPSSGSGPDAYGRSFYEGNGSGEPVSLPGVDSHPDRDYWKDKTPYAAPFKCASRYVNSPSGPLAYGHDAECGNCGLSFYLPEDSIDLVCPRCGVSGGSVEYAKAQTSVAYSPWAPRPPQQRYAGEFHDGSTRSRGPGQDGPPAPKMGAPVEMSPARQDSPFPPIPPNPMVGDFAAGYAAGYAAAHGPDGRFAPARDGFPKFDIPTRNDATGIGGMSPVGLPGPSATPSFPAPPTASAAFDPPTPMPPFGGDMPGSPSGSPSFAPDAGNPLVAGCAQMLSRLRACAPETAQGTVGVYSSQRYDDGDDGSGIGEDRSGFGHPNEQFNVPPGSVYGRRW